MSIEISDNNFIQYTKDLNEDQKNIVIDEYFLIEKIAICIIACAGSGKTKVIILKIIFMILILKCEPKHFFVATFTRNAANEIKDRLLEFISQDQLDEMTIGTFHSIAYSKVFGDDSQIVEDNIENSLYKYEELLNPNNTIINNLSLIAKNNMSDNDSSSNDIDSDEDSVFGDMINNMTFEDNDEISIKEDYKYIFIDEYQDINEIQELIIRHLYKNAKLLVAVGDDQQNIYTFRDTNIKYILNFTENYENSTYKYLNKNYRCNENIVKLANIVLSYNENKIDKTIVAMKKKTPVKIHVVSFLSQQQQNDSIIGKIKEHISKRTCELHNIAIIARNNFALQILESKFAEQNIPSYYSDKDQDELPNKDKIQNVKNRVILTTIHGTKGLEFNNVYIIDVNRGTFPNDRCNDIEEERRLFYVAITRARNKLKIFYIVDKPSSFISEINNHIDRQDIIKFNEEFKDVSENESQITKQINDYSIPNIINNLKYLDFEEFTSNIFNHTENTPNIINLHDDIPDFHNDFCSDRNLIVTNVTNSIYHFIELFITRTIMLKQNKMIEDLNYILCLLHNCNHGINNIDVNDISQVRIFVQSVDRAYDISLNEKTDEELMNIITYYKSGLRVYSKFSREQLKYYNKAYKSFRSNQASKDIIYDIFIISLMKGLIKGRRSLFYLLNFDDTKYIERNINKSDIIIFKPWLEKIEQSCSEYFNNKNIQLYHTLQDEEIKVKGVFDLYDDNISKIKCSNTENIKLENLIELLSYVSLARRKGIIVNSCSLYNPLYGKLYKWDLTEWNDENDVICFLSKQRD